VAFIVKNSEIFGVEDIGMRYETPISAPNILKSMKSSQLLSINRMHERRKIQKSIKGVTESIKYVNESFIFNILLVAMFLGNSKKYRPDNRV
jgi:hypothetical protein